MTTRPTTASSFSSPRNNRRSWLSLVVLLIPAKVVGVASALILSTYRRRPDIGIMRTMRASRLFVIGVFFPQSTPIEPLGGLIGDLDRESANQVMQLIGEINRDEQTTFPISTHDENIAAHCPRRISVHDGEVSAN